MNSVAVCHNPERSQGLKQSLAALAASADSFDPKGRAVFIKPNFNTADPAPGASHNDTLLALIDALWERGAASISLGDRGYSPTRRVLEDKGLLPLLKARDARVVVFDELAEADWITVQEPGRHWPAGFRVARPVVEADFLALAGCLKTHAYGGVFTMSLKLAVGAVPGNNQGARYMNDLHSSPHQRKMIAEINTAFKPDLVVLDGVEAFVDGGPMSGTRAKGDLTLAATNRVAADAVGLAALKLLGANRRIMETPIFGQEQIARAVELGLGPAGPGKIEILPADPQSRERAEALAAILQQG